MLRSIKPIVIAAFILLLSSLAAAADYQSLSTEELSQLRGTMFDKPQADRDAFREEWQKRIELMTDEEKNKYLSSGSGRGAGNRSGTGLGDGSGRGRGNAQQGQGQQGPGGQGNGNNGKGRK